MKAYKINLHSFIDVITNSSSELFVSTDQKMVEFFKSILNEEDKDLIQIQKFKDFKIRYEIDETQEDYQEKYGHLTDEDDILLCNVDSEEIYYKFPELLIKLSFKNLWE